MKSDIFSKMLNLKFKGSTPLKIKIKYISQQMTKPIWIKISK